MQTCGKKNDKDESLSIAFQKWIIPNGRFTNYKSEKEEESSLMRSS